MDKPQAESAALTVRAVPPGERIDTGRSLRLEWAIVVLIVAEIALSLFQMARGRGH